MKEKNITRALLLLEKEEGEKRVSEAQRRMLQIAKRAGWTPDVAAQKVEEMAVDPTLYPELASVKTDLDTSLAQLRACHIKLIEEEKSRV